MTIAEEPRKAPGLIQRAMAMLLHPRLTWDVIDDEPASTRALLLGYAAPLVAIGPVCAAISELVWGASGSLGLTYHPPLPETIGRAVFSWMFGVASVYLFALVMQFLSGQFGGSKDRGQALKLATYMSTAGWLAGVFQILPRPFAGLSILGLYSFYLLNLGLPRLMRVEGDRALLLTICGIIGAMGVFFLAQTLASLAMGPLFTLTRAGAG